MFSVFGLNCATACKPSDPTQDTVKVNMPAPPALMAEEEEQMKRMEAQSQEHLKAEEARLRAEQEVAEAARRRAAEEMEARRLAEEQRLLKEKIAREREEAERQRLRRAQEAAEAERRRQEQEEAEEAARKAEVERLEKEKERKAAVAKFLKDNGFKGGINDGKKSMMTTTFPIHCAAEKGDERIVRMLLEEGANPKQLTSSKKSAVQMAQKKDKKGSHAAVIQALSQ